MKKLVIGGLAVLLALSLGVIIACDDGIGGEVEYTNVIYSADGKNVTLLLEGAVPVDRAARALSSDIAKRGHDFYEVVFVSAAVIRRASWTIGSSATITDVARSVDYVSPENAVLFVGKESDKTLLAVGRITSADGTTGGTTISPDTTRVTFTIASLIGDLSSVTLGTNGTPVPFNGVSYTPKNIPYGAATNAGTYEIVLSSGNIADFAPAMVVPVYAEKINNGIIPRTVQVPNGKGGSFTYLSNAIGIGASLTTNPPAAGAAAAFVPNVGFNLDTSVAGMNGGYIAITFSIPVNAITAAASNPAGDSAITWNIRPGFDRSMYDLDTGLVNSLGGAILVSVGDGPFDVIQIGVE